MVRKLKTVRPTLEARGLRKTYKGRAVVDDVDLCVKSGEVVGLLGPNGAGKTTTFYMIVGLTPPDRGHILYNEEDITSLPMYVRARRGISYLPQEPSAFRRLSVEDNLYACLLYTSPSPRDLSTSRMPSSA